MSPLERAQREAAYQLAINYTVYTTLMRRCGVRQLVLFTLRAE